MYNRKNFKNKFIIIFMLIFYVLTSFFQAKSVSAHSVYYLAVTIDITSFKYTGSVIQDDESFWSRESKHVEHDVGHFNNIKMTNGIVENVIKDDKINLKAIDGKDDTLVYSLPSKEVGNNHASDTEIDKLYAVLDNVLQGLNEAVLFINGYKDPSNLETLENITVQLLKATATSNASTKITHGKETFKISKSVPTGFKAKKGFAKTKDYVTITRESDGEQIVVAYQMEKKEPSNIDVNSKYFSWGSLALHAFKAHDEEIYTQNVSQLTKPSKLTEMVVDLIGWLVNDLRSLLGLYTINDLIFNEGSRGSTIYVHGIAPKAWIDNALTYHMIFQGFAISLLMFAIVKTLLQRNVATVNTNIRVSLIEGFQNIIITAILLALIIPLMNSLMYLNLLITQFFGETVPDYTALTDANAYTNLLGGVVMQLVYFGIGIYYNFIYIIRSVTLTILIALVPLFIVVFAFGGAWKAYFWNWFKEFVANVFMQSFHAMMLSLFYSFTMNTRGIESIVVLMAIIPLSNFFRQMIFAGAGDTTSKIGMNSLGLAANLGGSALNVGNKALAKGAEGADALKDKLNNRESKAGAANSTSASNGVSTASTSKANSNASKLKTLSTKSGGDTAFDTSKTMGAVNPQTTGTGSNGQDKVSAASLQNRINGNKSKFGGKTKEGLRKASVVATPLAKGAMNVGKLYGGTLAKTGALGMSMALGAEDFNMVKATQKIADSGTEMMNQGAGGVKDQYGEVKNTIDRKNEKITATQSANGDIDVNESISSFQQTAKGGVIKDAYTDGNNNQVIAYDKSKFDTSTADGKKAKAQLEAIRADFSQGNKDAIDHYKKQGIENVLENPNNPNDIALVYNQQGKKSMGLKYMEFNHKDNSVNYGYTAGGQIGENQQSGGLPPITPYVQPTSPKQPRGNKNKN